MSGVGIQIGDKKLRLIKKPLILIPTDKYNIIQTFMRAIKIGAEKATNLYDILSSHSKSSIDDSILVNYLSEKADTYVKTKDMSYVKQLSILSEIKLEKISSLFYFWNKSFSYRKLYLLGLNNKEIKECYLPLEQIYKICVNNPFKLPPISMEKCRDICLLNNIKMTNEMIECGSLLRVLYDNLMKRNWTCTPRWILARELKEKYTSKEDKLISDYGVILDKDMIYLEYPHKVETKVFDFIDKQIIKTAQSYTPINPLDYLYKKNTLTDEQKIAISHALNNNISIITGGAGSGKTTIIKELVSNLEIRSQPYYVIAFTGKSVARINEVLESTKALTVDRLIMVYNQREKVKHIIIDEISMMTTELFYRLIIALGNGDYKITFLGDRNQLPPIGWGFLMKEMLNCKRIPTYQLTFNHRIKSFNGDEGDKFSRTILENANELINSDRDLSYPMEFTIGDSFNILKGNDKVVYSIVKSLHNAGFKSDDIVCISPYNENLKVLNTYFQEIYLSKAKYYIDKDGKRWCVGDRVMMTENNYDICVMNGEEGIVVDVSDTGISADFFKGKIHLFKFIIFDEKISDSDILHYKMLEHSFSITIHKSQGSERKFVIIYIKKGGGGSFLNINLLYTAITRTQFSCWLVGDSETINNATITKLSNKWDGLCKKLKDVKNNEIEDVISHLIIVPDVIISKESGNIHPITSNEDDFFFDDQEAMAEAYG